MRLSEKFDRYRYVAVAALLLIFSLVKTEALVIDSKTAGFFADSSNAAPCPFSAPLFAGRTSPEVKCLQRYLNASGFFVADAGAGSPGNETEYYGGRTRRAVTAWQRENGLPHTGYFGPLSRAKYFELVSKTLSPSPLAPPPPAQGTSLSPVIESVTPAEVRSGEAVTVRGRNFLPLGNSIIVRFGVLDQKIENIPSSDGKTLTFVFEAPEMSPVNTAALIQVPMTVLNDLNSQLSQNGLSLQDLNQPYRNIRNEEELDAFLKTQGKSIKDLYDPYLVIVKNVNGQSLSPAPHFKGLRSLKFSP